jgi:hypothetical protein
MKTFWTLIFAFAFVSAGTVWAANDSDSDSQSSEETDATATASQFGSSEDEETAEIENEICGTPSFSEAYGTSPSAKYYGSKIAALEAQKAKYPGAAEIIDAKIAAIKKQATSVRATGATSSESTSTSDNSN